MNLHETIIERIDCSSHVYSVAPKEHIAPTSVKFGTGQRTVGAKFHLYRGRNVGIQPLNCNKIGILPTNLLIRSDSFAQFLRNFPRLYASIGVF